MERKLRFGILSTAKIGTEKVIPALQRGRRTEVVAIASRDATRAAGAAQRLGISKSYGSYEALLSDPDVEAIYNPLPNDLHVPLSVQALAAGKHVLCEKPIARTAAEARELLAVAKRYPRLVVSEAFMYRYHPQWLRARQLVRDGAIGRLRAIQTFFSFYNEDPSNIRHDPAKGGGSVMDVGCYAISLSRWLFNAEPFRASALVELDPRFGVDRLTSAILDFGSAGTAVFMCSMQVAPYQAVQIVGTSGRIELSDVPFNAPNHRPCSLVLQQSNHEQSRISFEVCDQYALQGDAFAATVLDGQSLVTPLEDAVANMEAIDAVLASGARGSWVSIR